MTEAKKMAALFKPVATAEAILDSTLPVNAEPSGSSKRKFSSKSTATEHQYEIVVRELSSGPKSTIHLRRVGVMMPSARILEMNRKLGYYIPTVDLQTVFDDQGFAHQRVAIYELIDRPRQAVQ